jgi:thiosulfate dehydrogenase (quinone) large subunit
MSGPESGPPETRSRVNDARVGIVTLLVVQIIVGYEWLSSGIAKVASGDFVSGLGVDLKEESGDAPHWYKSFLDGTVIPHARTFGVLIEVGELAVGAALIVAAMIWLVRWSRLSDGLRTTILVVTMVAALAATAMALNFHLASGANHPWLIPKEGFDETIDVDAVLVMFQIALFAFSSYLLLGSPGRTGHRSTAVAPNARAES